MNRDTPAAGEPTGLFARKPGMAETRVQRIDSFPFSHRVGDVMSAPVVSLGADRKLTEAMEVMTNGHISCVVSLDAEGAPVGILTERDVLWAFVKAADDAFELRVRDAMSSPVVTVPEDVFLYVGLGRMARLNLRHLVVVDGQGRAAGVLSARSMLKLRARQMVELGDQLSVATTAGEMDAVRRQLPDLCARLLAEEVPAHSVAAVISAVYCDITTRAAELAVASMEAEGRGGAPCPWCVLMLGSGGRGESLLSPDQDNAIIYDGDREAHDAWFLETAKRMNAILDGAGIPFCKGGVMAKNDTWRNTPEGWCRTVDRWLGKTHEMARMVVDIFYDFVPVYGERRLAEQLRDYAIAAVGQAPQFLMRFAEDLEEYGVGLGMFGRLQSAEDGRIDLKAGGLLPLVFAARCLALKYGCRATSTRERLAFARDKGLVSADLADAVLVAQTEFMETILAQQRHDIAEGRPPSSRVEPKRLGPNKTKAIKTGMHRVSDLRVVTLNDIASGTLR